MANEILLSSDNPIFNSLQGGALLSSTSDPGFHFMIPVITSFRTVQVCQHGQLDYSTV